MRDEVAKTPDDLEAVDRELRRANDLLEPR